MIDLPLLAKSCPIKLQGAPVDNVEAMALGAGWKW